MLPYIKEYGPPHRRLRIKNRKRLIVFLVLILLILLMIFIPKKGATQANYIEYKVAYGDTYWQIARELQEAGYRPREDIRAVVHELISKSGIRADELKEGDTIYIPDWEDSRCTQE